MAGSCGPPRTWPRYRAAPPPERRGRRGRPPQNDPGRRALPAARTGPARRPPGLRAGAPRPPGPPRKAAAGAEHIKVSRYEGADRRVSESAGGNRRPRIVQEVRGRAGAPGGKQPMPGPRPAIGHRPGCRGPRNPAEVSAAIPPARPRRDPAPRLLQPAAALPRGRARARVRTCRAPPAGRARAAHRP